VRQSHGNTRLEITWTILPALLLAGIAVPTVATQLDIRSEPKGERIEINVTGHQWWWEFEFPQYGFTTANEIHIPAGKNVYLTLTSADVIHSFWLPNLAGKRDAVPGRTSNLTLLADDPTPEGEPFFGVCAEFCGLAHADMRLRVFVDAEADFEAWAASQALPAVIPTEGLAADGFEVFGRVCSACHAVAGTDYELRLAPDLTHFGSRTTFAGATLSNDTANLREWLHNPSDLKPMDPDRNDIEEGRILGMPNFGLSPSDIDALVALLQGWK
jgi:cytochrome c oxidase subunit 2